MDSLITQSIAWPTLLISLLMFGFAPGAVLRMIVLAFKRDDPRRTELLAELPHVPRIERPFWVCEQLEFALFEGLAGRLAELIGWHRRQAFPGQSPGKDRVSRYLDLLEGFITALRDFQRGRQEQRSIPYLRVGLAAGSRSQTGICWMRVDHRAGLDCGVHVELDELPGVRGQITAISGNEICIRFSAPVRHRNIPATGSLRLSYDDRVYQIQQLAVAILRAGKSVNPQLIRALVDRTFIPFAPSPSVPREIYRLNRDQFEAVIKAYQVPDFLLITSPPGTGRTRTTSEIIDQYARKGERVLVVGATNMGVDNLLAALPNNITTSRIDSPGSLSRNAVAIDPEDIAEASLSATIGQADVVAGTCMGIALSGMTIGQAFDLLVIIEAENVRFPMLSFRWSAPSEWSLSETPVSSRYSWILMCMTGFVGSRMDRSRTGPPSTWKPC